MECQLGRGGRAEDAYCRPMRVRKTLYQRELRRHSYSLGISCKMAQASQFHERLITVLKRFLSQSLGVYTATSSSSSSWSQVSCHKDALKFVIMKLVLLHAQVHLRFPAIPHATHTADAHSNTATHQYLSWCPAVVSSCNSVPRWDAHTRNKLTHSWFTRDGGSVASDDHLPFTTLSLKAWSADGVYLLQTCNSECGDMRHFSCCYQMQSNVHGTRLCWNSPFPQRAVRSYCIYEEESAQYRCQQPVRRM